MNKILLFPGLFVFVINCFSQDESIYKRYNMNIGISAGHLTGPGISYRQWIGNSKYAVQATLLPIYYKDADHKNVNCSFSLGFLRTVSETKWLNLFVFLGSRFQYTVDDYYNTFHPSYSEEETIQAGGGPGIEIKLGRVSFNWMTGIRGKTNFNDLQEINFSTDVSAYYTF